MGSLTLAVVTYIRAFFVPRHKLASAVDSAADAKLTSYVETTEKTGKYPGTRLPPAPPNGCAVKEHVVVTRE